MLSSDSAIVEGLRSSSLTAFGLIQQTLSDVNQYFELSEKNRKLRLENTRLAYENFQLQDALLENIRLHKLLDFKQNNNYHYTAARIIGFSPLNFVTGYMLAITDDTPVQKNSAVITSEGLVGKIIKVSSGYAICQNLLDANSKVSVRIQRNRELGIVSWDGAKQLLLENIPNTIEVRKGDVLFTSGMSQIYPRNIKVGVVLSFQKKEEELFQTIHVKPTVPFNKIEEVFILQRGVVDEK